MAGQDFAHVEALQQPEDVRPMGQTKIMMLIMALLVVLAASFSGGFMMGRDQGAQEANSQDEARLLAQLKQQKEELAALRAQAVIHQEEKVSTTQVGELTFYNELPNQSVQPAPLNTSNVRVGEKKKAEKTLKQVLEQELKKQSAKKRAVVLMSPDSTLKGQKSSDNQRYQLQMASFQQNKEANAFILKLKAKGIVAIIQKVKLPNIGTWYRIYSGNFTMREQAAKAQERIKKDLKISSLIVDRD
ncbi:MAG: SPOR domain-containing protein [Mariprofundaceae bacterium]